MEITTYTPEIKAIFSIDSPISINNPKTAVPNAVANTIKDVVKAFKEVWSGWIFNTARSAFGSLPSNSALNSFWLYKTT